MRKARPLPTILLGLLLLAGAGCLRRAEQANFYLLEPLSVAAEAGKAGVAENPTRPVIGVGPVKLPGYLNRPQIALTVGQGQIRLDEFQRWSEPLDENFTRVLAENLRRLLPECEVVLFPWRRPLNVNMQVEIAVDAFHVTQEGQSLLEAQWFTTRENKSTILERSSLRLPADASSYAGIVAAHSRALEVLSREIATSLRPLLP